MNEQRQRTARTRERVTTSTYAPVLALMTTPHYELAPAAVLPEQFYDAASEGRHESGAVALIRAMLDDAIACYQKHGSSASKRNRRLATEAEAWLFSDDAHWPFAFVNVCGALGIEPGYVRRGLKRWRHRSLGQGQPKRYLNNSVRHALPIAA